MRLRATFLINQLVRLTERRIGFNLPKTYLGGCLAGAGRGPVPGFARPRREQRRRPALHRGLKGPGVVGISTHPGRAGRLRSGEVLCGNLWVGIPSRALPCCRKAPLRQRSSDARLRGMALPTVQHGTYDDLGKAASAETPGFSVHPERPCPSDSIAAPSATRSWHGLFLQHS